MKRLLLLMASMLFLVACGDGVEESEAVNEEQNDGVEETVEAEDAEEQEETEELPAGDQEACDIYAEVAKFVEEGETTNQVYEIIEDAFDASESNELLDLLDELLYQIEEDDDIEGAASDVSEWCGL